MPQRLKVTPRGTTVMRKVSAEEALYGVKVLSIDVREAAE